METCTGSIMLWWALRRTTLLLDVKFIWFCSSVLPSDLFCMSSCRTNNSRFDHTFSSPTFSCVVTFCVLFICFLAFSTYCTPTLNQWSTFGDRRRLPSTSCPQSSRSLGFENTFVFHHTSILQVVSHSLLDLEVLFIFAAIKGYCGGRYVDKLLSLQLLRLASLKYWIMLCICKLHPGFRRALIIITVLEPNHVHARSSAGADSRGYDETWIYPYLPVLRIGLKSLQKPSRGGLPGFQVWI